MKRIAWVFLIVLAIGFAFHQSILHFSIQHYLSYKTKKAGYALNYEEVRAHPHELIFIHPELTFGEDKGQVLADALHISYGFKPWSRTLELDVILQNPVVELQEGSVNLESLVKELKKSSSWLKIKGRLHTHEGQLLIQDDNGKRVYPFVIDHYFGKKANGLYALYDKEPKDPLLEIAINDAKASISAKQLDVTIIDKISKAIFPSSTAWVFNDGLVDGKITFELAQGVVHKSTGELSITNLSFDHLTHQFQADMQEVLLRAHPQKNALASLEFLNGNVIFSKEAPHSGLRDLTGSITLSDNQEILLSAFGLWNTFEQQSLASLQASFDMTKAACKLNIEPLDETRLSTLVEMKAVKLQEDPEISLKLSNVGPQEFVFAEKLMQNTEINPFHYLSGHLSGLFDLNLKNGELAAVKGNQIHGDHFFILYKPWDLRLGAERVAGSFFTNIYTSNPTDSLKFLNAEVSVDHGEVAFNNWDFNHIHTRLEVKNGELQASSATVQLAGLKGRAEIPGGNSDVLVRLYLDGEISELKPFVPERIQKGIDLALAEDVIGVQASVSKHTEGVAIKGKAALKNTQNPIQFGFSVKRSSLPECVTDLDFSSPTLTTLTPSKDSMLSHMVGQHLVRVKGYAGFHIHDGWIKAQDLRLEKWVGPFLFPEKEIVLSGSANVDGVFDSARLTVNYSAQNVTLENDDLAIQVDQIGNSLEKPGYHTIDFRSKEHFGHLPIADASYFEKNSGLLFTNMRSNIIFEGEKVHADDVETFCNGMLLAGAIDVDYSSPLKGCYDVSIFSDTLEGTFTQAQHILAHFDKPYYVTKIPLEGKLNFANEGGFLFLGVTPGNVDFQVRMDCNLSEGKIVCESIDAAVHELSLNFLYDLDQNILDLSDIQGILLHGKPDRLQEYAVQADKIHFSDFEHNLAYFDIMISDDSKDFIRIAGATLPLEGADKETVVFEFDKDKTHLGDIHPDVFELVISDFNRVEHLQLNTHFRLSTLLHDLHKIGRSKVHYINYDLLDDLNQLATLSGELFLTLNFEGADGVLAYDLQGQDVVLDQHQIKDFHLNGTKRQDRWVVEQLTLDQISVSAELIQADDLWKVDFLGIRFGPDFLLGLSGSYRRGDPLIHSKVNLFEADLAKLKRFAFLKEFTDSIPMEGKLKGSGELTIHRPSKGTYSIDLVLDTDVQGLTIQDIHFADTTSFKLEIMSDKGITLANFNSGILFDGKDEMIGFKIKQLDYDFASETISLDETPFSLPPQHMQWLSDELQRRFPEKIKAEVAEAILQLKPNAYLKGRLQLTSNPSENTLRLSLDDDTYNIFGSSYDLKGCTINHSSEECTFTALTYYNKHPVWVSTRINPQQPDSGETILMDGAVNVLEDSPILVHWHQDEENGLVIDTAKGHLAGIYVDVKENPRRRTNTDAFELVGLLQIDGNKAKTLISPVIAKTFETLELGSGYTIQGEIKLGKNLNADGDKDLRFFGMLTGDNAELKGYRFKNIRSQIILEPHSFQLLDFNLSDPSGTMHIGNLRVDKQLNGSWHLYAPLITAYEFRPSLLQEAGAPPPHKRKPLLVRQLYLQDLTGTVGFANSFTGHGSLDFINPQRKNLQNTIFAIPREILTRIGLNLSVLTPVSGTIHYEVQNSRIYLTKFKDVYSDNKISKFYLPPQGGISTIDFDGNLDVQVRFKQSTLLLKLVELFTINVTGTLKKPKYTLQQQKYWRNKEVFVSTDDYEDSAQ